MTADTSLWLTAAQVAARIGLTEAQVMGLFRSGHAPFRVTMFGRNYRVWHVDLDNFVVAGTPAEFLLEDILSAGFERALLNVLAEHMLRRDLRFERKAS